MKTLSKTMGALAAAACVLSAVPATAQGYYGSSRDGYRDSDRDGIPDRQEWGQDRDRDGRADQYDRYDNRRDRYDRDRRDGRWSYYGGNYGYNGYRGQWRSGQRYTYWRDRNYYINDWRSYGLPAPRPGYRYYRDRNGDIVMAAIATGVIAMILSGSNGRRW